MADAYHAAIRQAYFTKRDPKADIQERLLAHAKVLRTGMPTAGDSAKLENIAEAVADLCVAITGIHAYPVLTHRHKE